MPGLSQADIAAVTHAVSENNRLIGLNDLEGVLTFHPAFAE